MSEMKIKKPLLVSGLQRSGTTWTAKMITLSPERFYVLEPFNFLREPIHLFGAGTNFPFFPEVDEELFLKIRSGLGLSLTGEELKIYMKQSSSPKYHLYHLVRYITLNRRLKKGMLPVIQDPFAIFMAPWLGSHLDVRMLFLFRHPAAYINSMKRIKWGFNFDWLARQEALMEDVLADFREDIMKWAPREFIPFGIETQALVWNIFTTIMLRYREAHADWLFYRHEDLSREPIEGFKKIYREIGLVCDDSIIGKIEKFTGAQNRAVAKEGKMHTLRRNSLANIKMWQSQLSAGEIEEIRRLTSPVSEKLYCDEDWN